MPDTHPSRREFMMKAGVVGGAVATGGMFTGTAAADSDRTEPEYISFNATLLNKYKPHLITKDVEFTPSVYGFLADGAEADKSTSVCVYCVSYPYQKGVFGLDSHDGDHEWYYVHVKNIGTSDAYIDRVEYAAYHWLKGSSDDPAMSTDTNPAAYVYAKHHHHSNQQAQEYMDINPDLAKNYELEDLRPAFQVWLEDDEFAEGLADGVVYDPWSMDARGDWWADDAGHRMDVWLLRNVYKRVGLLGAENIDI